MLTLRLLAAPVSTVAAALAVSAYKPYRCIKKIYNMGADALIASSAPMLVLVRSFPMQFSHDAHIGLVHLTYAKDQSIC